MRTILVWMLILIGIAAFFPPFFTHGACSAEFDAVGNLLERARPQLLTQAQAQEFLEAHAMAYVALTAGSCESRHPPDVLECPSGVLLFGVVPVKDPICRFYRDTNVRFQLGYNNHSQLIRIQTDMNPYRILRVPIWGFELDVAK